MSLNLLRLNVSVFWNLSWTLLLLVVPLVGDQLVSRSESLLHRAVADSVTHSLIGMLIWEIVVLNTSKNCSFLSLVLEVGCTGFLSSIIDIDHFIAARSLKIKDAMSLPSRPFLHCSSIPFLSCILMITACTVLELRDKARFCWIVFCAFLSHHIRDATRRGLWFYPFGSTPPIPYFGYIGLTVLLPYVFDTEIELYIVAGCLSLVILIIIFLMIYFAIQIKRLKIDVQNLQNASPQRGFLKPVIQPEEELARRGFQLYDGTLNSKTLTVGSRSNRQAF